MNFLSFGDLAHTFNVRRQNVELKTNLARLSEELSSGEKSRVSMQTGDYSPIVSIERSLKLLSAYETATSEATVLTDTMQSTLRSVQLQSSELGPALLVSGNSEQPTMIQAATADAAVKFQSVVAALNVQVADRYVFSGASTDTRPLADADTIMSAISAAVASQTTAAGVEQAVDNWFDTVGGGFETLAYTGSTTPLAPLRLSEIDTASVQVMAFDPQIRSVLKGFALASLVGGGMLSGNTTERAALTRRAGEQLMSAESTLSTIRAKIGSAEASIVQATARNSAEKSAWEIARNEITGVDPFKTATELEATRNQLETLYALTVRMSRLSLADYLK